MRACTHMCRHTHVSVHASTHMRAHITHMRAHMCRHITHAHAGLASLCACIMCLHKHVRASRNMHARLELWALKQVGSWILWTKGIMTLFIIRKCKEFGKVLLQVSEGNLWYLATVYQIHKVQWRCLYFGTEIWPVCNDVAAWICDVVVECWWVLNCRNVGPNYKGPKVANFLVV